MDPLTALSVAGTVVQLIDFGAKLCILIKEISSAAGCPTEVVTLAQRLQATLQTLNSLNATERVLLENETATLSLCIERVEAFLTYLEAFRVRPAVVEKNGGVGRKARFFDRRKVDVRKFGVAVRMK